MNNEVAKYGEKTMTVKEICQALNVPKRTVLDNIKKLFPDKLQHGKTTYLNEEEVSIVSAELKKAHNKPNSTDHFVYLLETEHSTKIGKSSNPQSRIYCISCTIQFDTLNTRIYRVKNMHKTESFLHKKFSDKLVRGEWFTLSQEDKIWVDTYLMGVSK
jgi:DNA-binding Lrp family transcriptional regulator